MDVEGVKGALEVQNKINHTVRDMIDGLMAKSELLEIRIKKLEERR